MIKKIFKLLSKRKKKIESFEDIDWFMNKIDKKVVLETGREYLRESELFRMRLKMFVKELILNKRLEPIKRKIEKNSTQEIQYQEVELDIFTANYMLEYMFNFEKDLLDEIEDSMKEDEEKKKKDK